MTPFDDFDTEIQCDEYQEDEYEPKDQFLEAFWEDRLSGGNYDGEHSPC